eukprot:13147348-Alexandrium_andersonii.AAC.1
MAESPRGQGWPPCAPAQRLAGAPSEPPPNGRRTIGESALTERLGAPLRGAQVAVYKHLRP